MEIQKEIRQEYTKTLSEREQLAIWLHENLCKANHTEQCSFYQEMYHCGIKDDWNGLEHSQYLEKADQLLAVTSDIRLLKRIIQIAS